MHLFVLALTLAVLASVSFCMECDPQCMDNFTRCTTKWTVADCRDPNVFDNCPKLCGTCIPCDKIDGQFGEWKTVVACQPDCTEGDLEVKLRECDSPAPANGGAYCQGSPIEVTKCEGCSKPVTPSDLESACESCSSAAGNGFNNVECPETPKDFDSDGYRLAFRHTGNEIAVSDLMELYLTGYLNGAATGGCAGSQFKDPNLAFFWGDATEVVIDIFDQKHQRAAYITFALPGGVNHPHWDSIFNWDFIKNSEDQHYVDIREGSNTAVELKYRGEEKRVFYVPKLHNGCENDHVYFAILANHGYCWWDKVYPKGTGPEKTTIVYSPFKTAAHTLTNLVVASRMEMRIGGNFAHDAHNGFRRILRYPNGAGVDFWDFYTKGVTDSHQDRYTLRAGEVKRDLFRAATFAEDIIGAERVMLVVYDIREKIAEALTFRGTTNENSWFSKENLISTNMWNLGGNFNYFSLEGHDEVGRRVYINEAYHGCGEDRGFLIVSCLKPSEQDSCKWEDFAGEVKTNRDQLCAIYYSPGKGAIKWNSWDFRIASAIEIFVK